MADRREQIINIELIIKIILNSSFNIIEMKSASASASKTCHATNWLIDQTNKILKLISCATDYLKC